MTKPCGRSFVVAILAELLGPKGCVIAYEIDHDLAERARANPRFWPNVEVFAGDGGHVVGTTDARLSMLELRFRTARGLSQ
jgi:tRNA A58 N-methylase Trm61